LVIGTDVQAWDANLDDLAALGEVADNQFIVGSGAGTYTFESEATVRTTLDLYSATELDAGQLDNQYYTETELDAGQLDNQNYTET